jgi:hypothetical protein
MLGPTLFLLTILLLTATVAISGIGAFARASIQNATTTVMQTALNHGIQSFQRSVAAQLGAGGPIDPSNISSFGQAPVSQFLQNPRLIAPPAEVVEQLSSFSVTEDFVNSTAVEPACGTTVSDASTPDTVVDAQCSNWVAETRMAGQIIITVRVQPGGPVIAQRTENMTFRLFADAPFTALVGLKDGDARDPTVGDVNAVSPHEGDNGGFGGPSSSLETGTAPTNDTTIHIRYECRNGGNPCPGAPVPAGDNLKNLPWSNGGAVAAGGP